MEMKKKKTLFSILAFVGILSITIGVSVAFFNYTRTGAANTISVGRISFVTQQTKTISLTNLFPIDPTETGIMNDATKVGTVIINVIGDTTYTNGIEYLVSAVNVENSVGNKSLPISINVSVENNSGNNPETSLGTSDENYFTNRGASAGTSIYKVLANDSINEGDRILVGYIKNGATGVDGNIVIKAYIDRNKIAISDTYPESTIRTVIETNYSSSNCEGVLTGVTGASTYCATASSLQEAIDNEGLTSEQITLLVNSGIVEEYTNGTNSSWVGDREVFTTTEWNSLQANGVSFQVKVEANEGTWVEDDTASGTIPSCPGCKFVYPNSSYYFTGANVSTLSDFENNGDTLVDDYTLLTEGNNSTDVFLGIKFDLSGNVTNAYACAIKGTDYDEDSMIETEPGINAGTPFCVEGTVDGSKHADNIALISGPTLWNDSSFEGPCDDTHCAGSIYAWSFTDGEAYVENNSIRCNVAPDGETRCGIG